MTHQSLDRCGLLPRAASVNDESLSEFVNGIAAADDAAAISTFVAETAGIWGTMRSFTLIACYRMKELFEGFDTRAEASESTGHTSWTDWLTSIDWPISVTLIKMRILDMTSYRRAGASWDLIHGILRNAPTAGHDLTGRIIDSQGRLLAHIDEEDLPGGSLQGLMEAIATAPNPGQGRALVEQVSGRPRIYPELMVATGRRIYLNLMVERPERTVQYCLDITATDGDGRAMTIPPEMARWIAERTGAQLESYEG